MDKLHGPNVTKPQEFTKNLQDIMNSVYDLLETTKEYNLEPYSEDGCMLYPPDDLKTCFQVTWQFDRSHEFLQSLLDIIHVNFEPSPMGTFHLNANMDFLYSEIPESPFTLGYVSITSNKNEEFDSFWNNSVLPYVQKCGYNIDLASAVYAVASTGINRYNVSILDDVTTILDSGFSVDEVIGLICSSINTCNDKPRKKTYAGYCLDESIGSKIRLSLWFFMKNTKHDNELSLVE